MSRAPRLRSRLAGCLLLAACSSGATSAEGVGLCWDEFGFAYHADRSIVPPSTPGVPPLGALVNGGSYFCGLDAGGRAWFTRLSASIAGSRRVCGIADRNELFCWGASFGSVPASVLY